MEEILQDKAQQKTTCAFLGVLTLSSRILIPTKNKSYHMLSGCSRAAVIKNVK